MQWIQLFRLEFLVPLAFFTALFALGYWSDHGRYPWKHWTRDETIGAFSVGPAFAFFITGSSMIRSLAGQEFVFERWFVAVTLLVLSLYLFTARCAIFFRERDLGERERMRQAWETARTHR